jgi:hypothetical protein
MGVKRRFQAIAALGAGMAAAFAPHAAAGQAGSSHVAPKVLNRGSSCSAIAGPGAVVVQVFVHADGSSEVKRVISSTNAGNDNAALEIAANSTYAAGQLNGKANDEFFDSRIVFTEASSGLGFGPDVCPAAQLVLAGKYPEAKAKLAPLLQARPADPQANFVLGLAEALAKNSAAATAAFDKAGPIDPKYATVAGQAYLDQTQALIRSDRLTDAAAAASKAVTLLPRSPSPLYLRGVCVLRTNPAAAIVDLEKARSLAADAKLSSADIASIEARLAEGYAATGDIERARAAAKEVARLDPGVSAQVDESVFTAYFNGAASLVTAGKSADAIARLEAGAAALPAHAAQFYLAAASVMTNDKSPDWKKVKSETDKALAADPAEGRANFLAGVAAARTGQPKDALPFLNKAKSSTLYKSDAAFAKQVDDALKALGAAGR